VFGKTTEEFGEIQSGTDCPKMDGVFDFTPITREANE
jgi:hypothetical protein